MGRNRGTLTPEEAAEKDPNSTRKSLAAMVRVRHQVGEELLAEERERRIEAATILVRALFGKRVGPKLSKDVAALIRRRMQGVPLDDFGDIRAGALFPRYD